MNCVVGPQAELAQLTGTRVPSPDGGTVLLLDRGATAKFKTKLQVALAGVQGFTDRALITKMVGIIFFNSIAQLYHTASHDKKALGTAIPSIEHHRLRGGSTNMADALALLLDGNSPFVEIVVVVSDGKPDNAVTALRNGRLLKDRGAEILRQSHGAASLAIGWRSIRLRWPSCTRLSLRRRPTRTRKI